MSDEERQNWVEQVADLWDREAQRAGLDNWRDLSSGILLHIAARNPLGWPPNNPDPGNVGFRVEAWPHDPGANGEDYHSGHMPAAEVARVLRDIADRCEKYWSDPECPWDGQPGHAPTTPPIDEEEQRRAEAAKRAAWEATR
jgi:hypothetical protein